MSYLRGNFNPIPNAVVENVICEARNIEFPDSYPQDLKQWFDAMAKSRNTKTEFVFLSALGVVSTLLGPKTSIEIRAENHLNIAAADNVKYHQEQYMEYPPLYITILCEPGSGKSTAHTLAVQKPLEKNEVEDLQGIVIQDYTRKGLFEHLKNHKGMGLLSSAEMQTFFDQLLKKQYEGMGERQLLNKLYDNTAWSMTSAGRKNEEGKEKREVLGSNSLCIVGFSQPQPFVEVYRPLKSIRDGFTDRLLVCTIKPHLLCNEEVDKWKRELNKFPLQQFHTLYEKIYKLHENGRSYMFSNEAFTEYQSFSDEIVELSNETWRTGAINAQNYNKDKRNLCRLALSLHILVSTLRSLLASENENEMDLSDNDVPLVISKESFTLAKNLIDYFSAQREALNKVVISQCTSQHETNGNFMKELKDYIVKESDNIIGKGVFPKTNGFSIRIEECDGIFCDKNKFLSNMKVFDPSIKYVTTNVGNRKSLRCAFIKWEWLGDDMDRVKKALGVKLDSERIPIESNANANTNDRHKKMAKCANDSKKNDYDNLDGASSSTTNNDLTVIYEVFAEDVPSNEDNVTEVKNDAENQNRGLKSTNNEEAKLNRELNRLNDHLSVNFQVTGIRRGATNKQSEVAVKKTK